MLAGSQREEMSLVGEALPDHRRREEGKLLSGPVIGNFMASRNGMPNAATES
jgi:hypothetical protein